MKVKNKISRRKIRVRVMGATFVLAAVFAIPANGQVRSGGAFLKIMPGARQQGIAGSATGVIDDLYAIYANPGAAGFAREWQWAATYSKWIADIYSASLIYGRQVPGLRHLRTRFALGVSYLGLPDFDSSRRATAAASASDLLVAGSLGQPFRLFGEKFSLGANVKYLDSRLAQYESSSWMADVGLLYRSARFRFLSGGDGFLGSGIFSAGIALDHIGQSLTFISTGTPLPKTFRAGAAFNTGTHAGLQLHVALDYRKPQDEDGAMSVGTEISWGQIFSLRGGYDFESRLLSHYTFGASITLNGTRTPIHNVLPGRNNALRFDLAAAQDADLFSRPYRGSVTHQPVGPEKFDLLEPVAGALVETDTVQLAWEAAPDPDLYDEVGYWLLVDQDSVKLADLIRIADQKEEEFFNALEATTFFVSQKLDQTHSSVSNLAGGDYFWSVLAYDRDRHFRFAETKGQRIARFRVAMPDVEITAIEFDYSPWITEDDFQGTLRIIITNKGQRTAKNFSISLYDTLADKNGNPNGFTSAKPVVQATITELQPAKVDTIKLEWRTLQHGLHEMAARIDEENGLKESNKANNNLSARFYTIPKGAFRTGNSIVARVDSLTSYEAPFIAEVFFDSSSAEIKPPNSKRAMEPFLGTLATRLKAHPDLKISLRGFADPSSSEREVELATARTDAVRDFLLGLGVNDSQITSLKDSLLVPRPRLPRDPTDARWLLQERRRVEISTAETSQAVLFDLVSFSDTTSLSVPLLFNSSIQGAVPLKNGTIQIESGELVEAVALTIVAEGGGLMKTIPWHHGQANRNTDRMWIGKNVSYAVAVADTLGRQFRTLPNQVHLQTKAVLRKQVVAWPLKIGQTKLLYDFYWSRLFTHIDRMLEDKNLHMRFSGHACALGPEAFNMKLSKDRAVQFRKEFLSTARERYSEQQYQDIIRRLDLDAKGFGEKRPFGIEAVNIDYLQYNQTPLERKLNRRIRIEFYYPQPSQQTEFLTERPNE